MKLSQIEIHKDGVHVATVPKDTINRPVGVPSLVWEIIKYWEAGANYTPKYKGFTWGWQK